MNGYNYKNPNGKSLFWLILFFASFIFFYCTLKSFLIPINTWWMWIIRLANISIIFAIFLWSEIVFVEVACKEQWENINAGYLRGNAKNVIFEFVFELSWVPMIFIWMIDYSIITDNDFPIRFILICSILPSIVISISFMIKVMRNAWTLKTKLLSFFHFALYSTAVYAGLLIIIIILILSIYNTYLQI